MIYLIGDILVFLLFGAASLVASAPLAALLLLLVPTRRWILYFIVWLPIVLFATGFGLYCWNEISLLNGPKVSGPTAPFADIPKAIPFLIGFLASIWSLFWSVIIGAWGVYRRITKQTKPF